MNKKILLTSIISVLGTTLLIAPISFHTGVRAEQLGDTPESGVVSYIRQIYNSLVSLGYGSDSAGSWGNWGAMWNRIRSASEWTPSGTAGADDVAKGKTFYSNSRTPVVGALSLTGNAGVDDVASGKTFYSNSLTKLTGTALFGAGLDYSLQSLQDYDDYRGYRFDWNLLEWIVEDEDTTVEESKWIHTSGDEDTGVWQDTRTGLYWSAEQGEMTNEFTREQTVPGTYDCPFFDSNPRGSYVGGVEDCGEAINYCATLELDADGDGIDDTGWYLPSQKELLQAYLDGMYNQTTFNFAGLMSGEIDGGGFYGYPLYFWSSTMEPDYESVFAVSLAEGYVQAEEKDSNNFVRCVFRN